MIEGGSQHYKGGTIEPLELIEAQGINFHLGNVIKYATRADYYIKAGKYVEATEALTKAAWYCERQKTLLDVKK